MCDEPSQVKQHSTLCKRMLLGDSTGHYMAARRKLKHSKCSVHPEHAPHETQNPDSKPSCDHRISIVRPNEIQLLLQFLPLLRRHVKGVRTCIYIYIHTYIYIYTYAHDRMKLLGDLTSASWVPIQTYNILEPKRNLAAHLGL